MRGLLVFGILMMAGGLFYIGISRPMDPRIDPFASGARRLFRRLAPCFIGVGALAIGIALIRILVS